VYNTEVSNTTSFHTYCWMEGLGTVKTETTDASRKCSA